MQMSEVHEIGKHNWIAAAQFSAVNLFVNLFCAHAFHMTNNVQIKHPLT